MEREEKKMTKRRTQEGRKLETRGEREQLKAAPFQQAGEQAGEGKKEERAVAALNYGARASFIRIPSPHCSLSGGIKEEDTQSGFSLRPYRQHTQKTALTAAERD